ncbi:MAG: mannitol dehydrogenase family protein [Oscillospiraceae bacterium]|nr:mannitol dehydrogenase family protein [Oscillospiraceae bacterium]
MKLSDSSLRENRAVFAEKGYQLPQFDREAMKAATADHPTWVHFGAGNIFRGFLAPLAQQLLDERVADTGIVVAVGFDPSLLNVAYRPFDNLTVAATLCASGEIRKKVVASIADSICMVDGGEEWLRLVRAFENPSLQMASLTITEKGYNYLAGDGTVLPNILKDMEAGPDGAVSYLGRITALCHKRFLAGGAPIALVSMDNCSHNGSRLEAAVLAIGEGWLQRGLCGEDFVTWLRDRSKITFPWSMIDKITPRPDESVQQMLEADGLEGMELHLTRHGSYTAAFVNTEEAEYLVIEDKFPNGRPALERTGVIFTDGETVDMVETMKVCTCLNPLHTAMSVVGCLLGFTRINAEMKDADLHRLVEEVGYTEGLPVVVDPGVIDPKAFIDEVIYKRLPNPFLQDDPRRIATDTSQKIPVRFGGTIRKYAQRSDLDVKDLKCISFVLAAWCRYLMGIDDAGNPFTPSDDPMLAELMPLVAKVQLGQPCDVHATLQPILSNAAIMGSDLYEVGLARQVEDYFARLITAPGAVRAVLHEVVNA